MSLQLVSVSPLSQEFGQIEFDLQMQLKTPKAQVTECFDLSNSHVSTHFSSFMKRQDHPNVVHVFVPTESLHQPLQEIAAKGIRVDRKRGFRFRVGSFEFDESQPTGEVVRLAIALGNTLNFQPINTNLLDGLFTEDVPTSSNLRDDYNSLCVSGEGDYVVFHSHQVKPCHLVRFTTVQETGDNVCEVCGKRKAVVWCVNDSAKLCKECDHESHTGKKMFERHKRIPIEDAMAAGDMCPVHGDSRVEFYCTKCKVPLCVKCKVTGSHSKGDAASHKLVSIKDAYEMAVAAASEADAVVVERERMIDEQLKKVCQKLEGVVANEKDVEDEVMRIARTVIENAKMLAGERALLLRSMKTELERKKEELKGACEMLECHKAHSEQVLFVQAFDRYRMMVKGMKDIQRGIDIDGDLFVHGYLDVSYNAKRGSPGKRLRQSSMGEEEDIRESRRQTPSPEKRRFPVEYTKLTDIAERKKRRYDGELPFQPFQGSRIVPSSKANTLYLCFPFREVPETRLLFSTERDGRSISKMHELIDGIGITAIIVKSGSYVFGGFAAAKWTSNGKPFGEKSSSFLFSLTHNAFIPYRPKVNDACHLLATPDSFTFGRYDLKLADDFDDCSAIIENSYGLGFERGGSDATTFMAGAPTFSADLVEVWGFFTLEKL